MDYLQNTVKIPSFAWISKERPKLLHNILSILIGIIYIKQMFVRYNVTKTKTVKHTKIYEIFYAASLVNVQ